MVPWKWTLKGTAALPSVGSMNHPPQDHRRAALHGVLLVSFAYCLVGASFTANSLLGDYPYAGGQAVRYALAFLLLLPLLGGRAAIAPVRALTPRQWGRIALLAGVGMVGFNLAVLAAERTAEPAVPGVFVGCAPVIVAVLVPLMDGRRPTRPVLYGALLVAAGAFTVQGWGRTDAVGVLWSVAALVGEVGFAVLAAPVLRPLGPRLLTACVCGVAAVESAAVGLLVDGAEWIRMPGQQEAWALLWQAAVVTVIGFVAWYMGIQRIGTERATLFTGLIPVAAALSAPLVGTGAFGAAQAAGGVLVGAGAVLGSGLFGFRADRAPSTGIGDSAPTAAGTEDSAPSDATGAVPVTRAME
ncbi:Putative integral membrane protein [Streptomyces clavuligerus]|uniref:Putative integral membrane protein n=2 Tax=Streptomyces clavuligerus TaxID=1901 RepID=E2Q9K1_STRCL|nr:Putative integral membrane protein [Streptomyces clavuligerus]